MARGVKWKNPPGSAARSRNKETKPQTHLALSSEVGPKAPRLRNGLCPPMGMVRPCSGPPAGEGCKAEKTRKRVIAHSSARTQLPTSPSPTTRRCSLLINSLLCTSAAFISAVICFKVLVFDPKTTVPPITAAIAPTVAVGSNLIAPMTIAKIKIPPAATAAFEMRMILRHLSTTSVSSSRRASMCKICRRRSWS